jgi:hypothetical protein
VTLAHDLRDLRLAQRSGACSPRLPRVDRVDLAPRRRGVTASWPLGRGTVNPRRSPLAAVGLWQAATARSEEAQMATRPGNGQQATRKQGNGLAVATLAFGVVGLLLGRAEPAGTSGRPRRRHPRDRKPRARTRAAQPGGPWHDRRWPGRRPGLPGSDAAVPDGLLRELTRGARQKWPHNCGTYGLARPAEMWESTVLGRRSIVRIEPSSPLESRLRPGLPPLRPILAGGPSAR